MKSRRDPGVVALLVVSESGVRFAGNLNRNRSHVSMSLLSGFGVR